MKKKLKDVFLKTILPALVVAILGILGYEKKDAELRACQQTQAVQIYGNTVRGANTGMVVSPQQGCPCPEKK